MSDFYYLQKNLGIAFDDISNLEQALVHRSYLNESETDQIESNERLEFLGDAVLGFVVARNLYDSKPDFSEGDLTRMRSSLVRTETLARVGRKLNLGEHLFLGKGEDESGGRNRKRNLACTVEAVIGAVYIDQGFAKTEEFILRILADEMGKSSNEKPGKDPKSKLQETIQSREHIAPKYRVVDVTGPDHERMFSVEVMVGDTLLGEGTGRSKRAAEQEAASRALEKLEGESFAQDI